MDEKYNLKTVPTNTKLYKTTEYNCDDIFDYMKLEPSQPCKSNKMLWLSEDKERALSYGPNLKMFQVEAEMSLWNLLENDYFEFFFRDETIDDEFTGKMQSLSRLFGKGSPLNYQAANLYSFLSGSGTSVRSQLSTLEDLKEEMDTNTNLKVLNFDGKTLDQMHVTPDGKTLYDVINEYITIGINLDQEQLNLTNQRLSIYVFDQILLKFMCINEKNNPKGIKGWYVPKVTTVWTEIVKGQSVPDMGEIALFDCNSLSKCEFSSEKASLKKKQRRKSKKKRFTKKSKKKKRKSKGKKKSKRRKYKRLTKKGREWVKSMSNYMKQKRK